MSITSRKNPICSNVDFSYMKDCYMLFSMSLFCNHNVAYLCPATFPGKKRKERKEKENVIPNVSFPQRFIYDGFLRRYKFRVTP